VHSLLNPSSSPCTGIYTLSSSEEKSALVRSKYSKKYGVNQFYSNFSSQLFYAEWVSPRRRRVCKCLCKGKRMD